MLYTKGPWIVTKYGYEKYSVNGHNMVEVCSCWSERNASLIAAAPELLEALEGLVDEFGKLPRSLGYEYTHMKDAIRVIKKAKGEI